MLLHREILRCCQRHIGNKQTLNGRVLSRVHKADDTVEYAGISEDVLEVEVVVVGQTHTAEDDLIHLCAQGHVRHHLVIGLVGVCEERNLLTGYQGVVQVDTGNTGGDKFRRLFTTNGVHGRTTDLHLFTFHYGSAINRFTVSIEETAA